MAFNLLRFLYHETAGAKLRVTATSLASGLSRGLLLALINSAAASTEHLAPRRLLAFVAVLLLYLASTYDSLLCGRTLVETIAQRLRLRLLEKLLRGPLRFVETAGASELYTCLDQDIARLSGAALLFVDDFHTIVLLVFALGYLSWLTPIGLVAVLLAIVAGVLFHVKQENAANRDLVQARAKATEFFHGIDDVVRGFKELKQHRARHTDLMTQVSADAHDFRRLTLRAAAKFIVSSLTSAGFLFVLLGALVFTLPALTKVDNTVRFQLLASILFIFGPVESLIGSMSGLAGARVALLNLQRVEQALDGAIGEATAPSPAHNREFNCLTLDNLHYRFVGKSPEECFAIGPIALELRRGEVLFIVGGNGSGKTTLLKLLTGLYAPDEGRVLLDGQVVDATHGQVYRELFAAVFSDFHLFRRLYGIAKIEPEWIEQLLARLQLSHKTRFADGEFLTTQLSTGQRKRLAYAVARLTDRQIYVFDEFAADQDPGFREFFYHELVPELRRQGKSVVAVTHDDRYFGVADRLVKMDYGRIIEMRGSPAT